MRLPVACELDLDGVAYTVAGKTDEGYVQLQADESLAFRAAPIGELLEAWGQGRLKIFRHGRPRRNPASPEPAFDALPERLRSEARRAEGYVKALLAECPGSFTERTVVPVLKREAERLGDDRVPSFSTAYRWHRRWRDSGGDIRTLIPDHHRKGNRTRRVSPGVIEHTREVVEEFCMRGEEWSPKSMHQLLAHRIGQANAVQGTALPVPGIGVVRAEMSRLDPMEVATARHGPGAAKRQYVARGKCPGTSRPLEVVEIDHTLLDVMVVDRRYGVTLGRPWLTVALDRHTRLPVGMCLGFEPPGYLTVMRCLRHLIMPKGYVRERFPDIEGDWPCHGLPETIVVDNGKEFHSESFRDACSRLRVAIQYCVAGEPWLKGKVERFFGTLARDVIHRLPGTTFSNIRQRGEYKSQELAQVTIDELDHKLHQWICDLYAESFHTGLLKAPRAAWQDALSTWEPQLPTERGDLDILVAAATERMVRRDGVELWGLVYGSEGLSELYRKLRGNSASKVRVKYDPGCIDKVWVEDRERHVWIEASATDREYARGLSLHLHQLVRRKAVADGKGRIRISALARARTKLAEATEAQLQRKGGAKAARAAGHGPSRDAPANRASGPDTAAAKPPPGGGPSGSKTALPPDPGGGPNPPSHSREDQVGPVPRDEEMGSEELGVTMVPPRWGRSR